MDHETKWEDKLETELSCIAHRSERGGKFDYLIQFITVENLAVCFFELDRNKAVGVDRETKDDYGKDLIGNLEYLVSNMKTMSYRPGVVREVLIPKANGKMRPLGIANIEDKIVQSLFAKIVMAIYEPHFKDFSYGFRPNRNCHQAIKRVWDETVKSRNKIVIDVDLKNYFGEIDHQKLHMILEMKIQDKTFLQYMQRMLKVDILRNGTLERNIKGVPQGSILGPVLSNVYAHHVIDLWFDNSVKPNLTTLTDERDAERVIKALKGRLERASLKLNEEKTKIFPFGKSLHQGKEPGTFNFLGFTFFIGKSQQGFNTIKLKTSRKAISSKLKEINIWCKKMRSSLKLKEWWNVFRLKIEGHIRYYSVSCNSNTVATFVYHARNLFFKWCNRRSQKRSMSWEKFIKFEKDFPLPKVRVIHRLF